MENLEYGCSLIKDLLNVPTYIIDNEGNLTNEMSPNDLFNPLYTSKQAFFKEVISAKKLHFPLIKSTSYYENVIVIPINNIGTVIIGPVLSSNPTRMLLDELATTYGKKEMEETLNEYYYSLPVVSATKLVKTCKLFYFIFQKKLEDRDILIQNIQPYNHLKEVKISTQYILEAHQNSSFHHDPIAEKKIYQFIIDGQKENLLTYWKAFKENTSFDFGKLSKKNEVRNQKNLTIAIITLATRAAITGGLHPEIAYTLGDRFIQDLEELQEIKDIHLFTENILYEFADKVEKTKRENYSRPIFQCRNYIYKHIYEHLTLQSIAEHLSISPKYLSNLFKKEVGIPISEYIQQTKIEEAKKLMTFAEHSLSEIHALLNFTDQSYFTKVFKKYTGITPKQFMKKPVSFL